MDLLQGKKYINYRVKLDLRQRYQVKDVNSGAFWQDWSGGGWAGLPQRDSGKLF